MLRFGTIEGRPSLRAGFTISLDSAFGNAAIRGKCGVSDERTREARMPDQALAVAARATPAVERIPMVMIGGLPIAAIDRVRSAELMADWAVARRGSGQPLYITSANGQVLSLCAADPAIRDLFLASPLIHALPLEMQHAPSRARRHDRPLPRRGEGGDRTRYQLLHARRDGGGAAQGRKAVTNVRKLYPGLELVGSRHGYFRPEEEDAIIADINTAQPDILWVAMGAPREQQFAVRNRERLTGVGGRTQPGARLDAAR
jgi:N-acetylglucosaminyldiphosphoundecaprenol N-acetyl-beta-D-mannosaminyltransferase